MHDGTNRPIVPAAQRLLGLITLRMESERSQFTTTDIKLAASLTTLGFEFLGIENGAVDLPQFQFKTEREFGGKPKGIYDAIKLLEDRKLKFDPLDLFDNYERLQQVASMR